MRHEIQHWSSVRITAELIVNGLGLTGENVNAYIRRLSDGKYWNDALVDWQVAPVSVTLAEYDATNWPGFYQYQLPDDALTPGDLNGYFVAIQAGNVPHTEYVRISVLNPWAENRLGDIMSRDNAAAQLHAACFPAVHAHDGITSGSVFGLETTTAHASRFSPSNAPGYPTGTETWMVGWRAILYRESTGAVYALRVRSVAAGYIELEQDDGTAPPVSIASGDVLMVLHAQDVSPGYILRGAVEGVDPADGTVADVLQRTLRARHHNVRIVYTGWNAQGKPTAGYLLEFASKADADGDADPWPLATARYDFTATYDGSGRLTDYKSTKTT